MFRNDGDQLTIAAVKDKRLRKCFKCFIPTYMFIDRATGQFDPDMDFKKDYAAVLSSLWTMDTKISEYLSDPSETTELDLRELGIYVHDLDPEEYQAQTELYHKAEKAPKDWINRSRIIGEAVERNV